VKRDHEPQRTDEVGGISQEQAAFVQGLADEMKLAVLEVAQAAVDEFGGNAGSTGGEIPLVDQADAEAAKGGVQGDTGSGDAAAEDKQVEGAVREGVEVPLHGDIVAPPSKKGKGVATLAS
jgi:hypothetical protein